MQLPSDILAHDFAQPPLIRGVDVLIVLLDLEFSRCPLFFDLL